MRSNPVVEAAAHFLSAPLGNITIASDVVAHVHAAHESYGVVGMSVFMRTMGSPVLTS
jgi:uncharacterized alkaline shock family protein YloU